MNIGFRLSDLEKVRSNKKPGYVESLFRHGQVNGDILILNGEDVRTIFNQFYPERLKEIPSKPRPSCRTCEKQPSQASPQLSMPGFNSKGVSEHGPKTNTHITFSGSSPEMPSLFIQAKNLGNAIGRITKAVAKRERVLVSEDETKKRLALCEGCPFLNKEKMRCGKCGCPVKRKALFQTERCPISKW